MKKKERKFYLVDSLLQKRGILCEWCQALPWTQKHHAILRRDNRFPELDVEENYMCVCARCHDNGEIDSNKASITFYFVQIARGYDMANWLLNLPLKLKPNYTKYKAKEFDPAEPLEKLFRDTIFE